MKIVRLRTFIFMTLCFFASSLQAQPNEALKTALAKIRYHRVASEVERDGKEEAALALLNNASSREDRGLVYATIASMYSEHGWTSQKNSDRAIKYSKLALGFPHDPATMMRLYGIWGDCHSAHLHDPEYRKKNFAAERKHIVTIWLTGLKATAASVKQKNLMFSGVSRVNCWGDSPVCAAKRKVHDQELTARREQDIQNRLITYRREIVSRCVEYYAEEPYAQDEFRSLLDAYISDSALKHQMLDDRDKLVKQKTAYLMFSSSRTATH